MFYIFQKCCGIHCTHCHLATFDLDASEISPSGIERRGLIIKKYGQSLTPLIHWYLNLKHLRA